MVGHVFPVAVSDDAIVFAEPFFLALDEDGRGSAIRNEAAVRVEDGFTARVLHYSVCFHYDDGAKGKFMNGIGRYRGRDGVSPNYANLPVLIIVKSVNFEERVLVVRR